MKKLFKAFFLTFIGFFTGLLCARKSGKRFSKELKNAEHPFQTAFKEIKETSGASLEEIKQWAQNSEEVKKILEETKKLLSTLGEEIKKETGKGTQFLESEIKTQGKRFQNWLKE